MRRRSLLSEDLYLDHRADSRIDCLQLGKRIFHVLQCLRAGIRRGIEVFQVHALGAPGKRPGVKDQEAVHHLAGQVEKRNFLFLVGIAAVLQTSELHQLQV